MSHTMNHPNGINNSAQKIIGVDFDVNVLENSRIMNIFNSKFDSNYNQGYRREQDALLQV